SAGRFGGLLRSRKSTALMAVAGIAIIAGGVSAAHLMASGSETSAKVALAAPAKASDADVKEIAAPAPSEKSGIAALPSEASVENPEAEQPAQSAAPSVSPDAAASQAAVRSVPLQPAEFHTASVSPDEAAS